MAARPARSSQDDEEYWSSSGAKNKKNPFGDDVGLKAAQQLLKQPFLDNVELDWEESAWDSSARTDLRSVRYRPSDLPSSRGGGDVNSGIPLKVSHDHPMNQISIEDAVGSKQSKRQPTLTEMSKLEAEINCLKRNLDSARKQKFAKIPVRELVQQMILGQPYSLEMYKSKEDKVAFLDCALEHHDGNVITAAVLHMQATIKPSIFHILLMQRPVAVDHYLNYLLHHHNYDQYLDMLGLLGRHEDAAMFKYKQCISKEPAAKIRHLKACLGAHFQSDPSLSYATSLIQEQIALLERQIPIEEADKKDEMRGDIKFKEFPRKASIVDTPVITTLYYACLYHYQLPDNNLASPQALRNVHRLTDKQFMWTALQARSKLKYWQDLDALFQTKGWLGGTKMKAAVGFDRVVAVLQKMGAPRNILNKYCKLVEPSDQRLMIGEKYGCHETVLETYMGLKDRQGVMAYQSRIKANSQEWFYANDILRNTSVKWKN